MASGYNLAYSATTPAQHPPPLPPPHAFGDPRPISSHGRKSGDSNRGGERPGTGRSHRSHSGGSSSTTAGTRTAAIAAATGGGGGAGGGVGGAGGGGGGNLVPKPRPGSFSSDVRSMDTSRSTTPRADNNSYPYAAPRRNSSVDEDNQSNIEERQAVIRDRIAKETKIKTGTENMLEALLAKNPKHTKDQRLRVESELSSSNRKIAELQLELEEEMIRAQAPLDPPDSSRVSALFRGSPLVPPSRGGASVGSGGGMTADTADDSIDMDGVGDGGTESPTYVLTETLQALEIEGMTPDFYVERANSLVELFKRHPTLKYDLAWSVFGLRVQLMLLSDSKEIVAAGYRLTRYAVADRKSLQLIRSLHTDELVILSLVKESKASIEREQALKFVRAFLDVKDGVREISRAVVRTVTSVAEHHEDRLRNISIMTLAEILVRDPGLIFYAGGFAALHDALSEGTFGASESLVASFLHVLDMPQSRKFLRDGCELEAVLTPFTDSLSDSIRHGRLKSSAKAISAMLKTWPGLVILARNRAQPLQSLLQSLHYPDPQARDLIMELLFDALRIKPPSWSSSFLAGRRLTTYGRVSNLRSEPDMRQARAFYDASCNDFDLTMHFSTLILATLVHAGLIQVRFIPFFFKSSLIVSLGRINC